MESADIVVVMHGQCIVHTDVKPDNIVLRSSQTVTVRRMRHDDFFVDKVPLQLVRREYIID